MSKTAVITGATSGMGAAFARRLAQDGYDLIITGRKKEIIQKVADEITAKNKVKVTVVIAEFSNDADIQKVLNVVKGRDDIEILINNAGQSGYDRHFEDLDVSEHEKLVKVHNIAPMRLISLVLPGMIKRQKGTIINVASIAGFLPVPGCSVYCGVKAFLKLYTQSLHLELRDKGIKVQALCPGFTDTNWGMDYFSTRLKDELGKSKRMAPEKVVDYSLKALKKNKWLCVPGMPYKMMTTLFPSLPAGMYYSMGKRMTPFR
jgi:short-subunit dehydrogenase